METKNGLNKNYRLRNGFGPGIALFSLPLGLLLAGRTGAGGGGSGFHEKSRKGRGRRFGKNRPSRITRFPGIQNERWATGLAGLVGTVAIAAAGWGLARLLKKRGIVTVMEHSFLDRYSHLGSVIHNLDARTKILSFLGLIVVTVLTPPQYWPIFLAHFALMALVLILSRVPVGYVLTRSLIILPFVLLTAVFLPFLPGDRPAGGTSLGIGTVTLTASGLQVFWNILLKGFIGVFAIILLSATTPFPRILEALRKFKIPAIFTLLLGFIYRYLFVLVG